MTPAELLRGSSGHSGMVSISTYLHWEVCDRTLPRSYYRPPDLAGREIETWEPESNIEELLLDLEVEELDD